MFIVNFELLWAYVCYLEYFLTLNNISVIVVLLSVQQVCISVAECLIP